MRFVVGIQLFYKLYFVHNFVIMCFSLGDEFVDMKLWGSKRKKIDYSKNCTIARKKKTNVIHLTELTCINF